MNMCVCISDSTYSSEDVSVANFQGFLKLVNFLRDKRDFLITE